MREVPVVGEQDQAFGVGVETADVEQALTGGDALGDDVTDAGTAEVVGHRRLPAARLVERDVDEVLLHDDADAVDADDGVLGIDAQALFEDDATVDLDPALVDEFLRGAPGGDAGLREHLLQAHTVALHRRTLAVDVGVLVLRGLRVADRGSVRLRLGALGLGRLRLAPLVRLLLVRSGGSGGALGGLPLLTVRCAITASGLVHF